VGEPGRPRAGVERPDHGRGRTEARAGVELSDRPWSLQRPVDEHDRRESPRVAGAGGRSAAVLQQQQQHRSIVMLMAAAHAMSVSFPLPSVRLDAFSQPAASAPGAGDRRLSS
jgi:hypothetical protein